MAHCSVNTSKKHTDIKLRKQDVGPNTDISSQTYFKLENKGKTSVIILYFMYFNNVLSHGTVN